MGRLGWSEYDYYTSSPEAFYFAAQGYFDKVQDYSIAIRNSTYINYRMNGGKESINSIWPLANQIEEKREPMTKERYEKILAIHKIAKKSI